ncbi:MAG: hypothetical protein IPG60_12290 [Bacteroidetes bacterium]|nr:hypothetical protein [Bacteroidota bacterium]MBP7399311.1 hypothetical protein [Chitinophagales bacterium]MBK7109732.1 hypothetical protein [Bacteroidota bacterium]MBK8487533.1 hypothetical protein [Bacteroidota bacterium]MBK8682722.1 hypothetical protein [Bacteroidota bacterium]
MKLNFYKIFVPLAIVFFFLSACSNTNDEKTESKSNEDFKGITLSDSGTVIPPVNPPAITTTPIPGVTNSGKAGVQHYTCPNNCVGSGSSAQGTCPVCSSAYQHNQAYHNTGNQTGGQPPATTIQPGINQSKTAAQNSKGIYHYTCSKGHPGGAGSAGSCASCGGALSHNQAYHE